jgi:hypothetical protein
LGITKLYLLFYSYQQCLLIDHELALTPEVERQLLLRPMGLVLAWMMGKMMIKMVVEMGRALTMMRIAWTPTTDVL